MFELHRRALLPMQRHDSQKGMGTGSLRAASPSASLDSCPSGYSLRSAKRRRVSPSELPSTSQGSFNFGGHRDL